MSTIRWTWLLSGGHGTWILVGGLGALGLAFAALSCSTASSGAGSGSGSGSGGGGPPACTTDSQCVASVPPSRPANCVTGKCNTVQGTCEYVAKDEDGDGHSAADCNSTNGVGVLDGDDCDDHDPNLYPGHPENCAPDAGAGSCAPGKISCTPEGTVSACMGGVTCMSNQTCCNAQCVASDENNCGVCGHFCQGGVCMAGACQPFTLASGQQSPEGLTIEATSVYWATAVNGGTSAVLQLPTTGGSPMTVAQIAGGGATGVAVGGGEVFWTPMTGPGDGGVLASAPLAGGTVQQWPGPPGTATLAVVVDASSVYWSQSGSGEMNFSNGSILKMPLAGGTPVTLATTTLSTGNQRPVTTPGLAVDASAVYWTDLLGNVLSVPIAGGAATTLASGQSNPAGLAVDAKNVYWANYATGTTDGSVLKVPIAGGAPTILAQGLAGPQGVAVDATYVYWTTNPSNGATGGGTVMRVPTAGGTATVLADNQQNPFTLALDANSIYWTNAAGGTVLKLAK